MSEQTPVQPAQVATLWPLFATRGRETPPPDDESAVGGGAMRPMAVGGDTRGRSTAHVQVMSTEHAPSPNRLLSAKEVAAQLGVAPRTLADWRADGDAPPAIYRQDRLLGWRQADVDAWLDAHLVRAS